MNSTIFIVAETESQSFYGRPIVFPLSHDLDMRYVDYGKPTFAEHIILESPRLSRDASWAFYRGLVQEIVNTIIYGTGTTSLNISPHCSVTVNRKDFEFYFQRPIGTPWAFLVNNDKFLEGLRSVYPEAMESFNVC